MKLEDAYAPRKSFLYISLISMTSLIALMLVGEYIVLNEGNRFSKHRAPKVSVQYLKKVEASKNRSFPGVISSAKTVDIQPMVDGMIMSSHFSEGQIVEENEILFTVDPRPYAANVSSAKGTLKALRANLQLTLKEVERLKFLLNKRQVSQNEYDLIKGRYELLLGEIASAEAELDRAELELEYTDIRAPFRGRVGKILIDPGNVITREAGAQTLTTLVATDTYFVDFHIDEQTYMELMVSFDISSKPLPFVAALNKPQLKQEKLDGSITSFDNRINPQTGTMSTRGTLQHQAGNIVPGMYVQVTIAVPFSEPKLLIPESAILTDHISNYVYILSDNNTAQKRHITLGEHMGQGRILMDGLTEGDAIIVSNISHIKADKKVRPHFIDNVHHISDLSSY